MQPFRLNLLLLFFFSAIGFANSQGLSATTETNLLHFTSTIESSNPNTEDWTFYLDEKSQVCYIDFETISVNLSDIMVKDASGAILKRDELWDLPVNTIYELDLKDLKPGDYEIELRTYTGVIKKEVTVSE